MNEKCKYTVSDEREKINVMHDQFAKFVIDKEKNAHKQTEAQEKGYHPRNQTENGIKGILDITVKM